MTRALYIYRARRACDATLIDLRNASLYFWRSLPGDKRAERWMRRAKAAHLASVDKWNRIARANVRRNPRGSHATRVVAPTYRRLPA